MKTAARKAVAVDESGRQIDLGIMPTTIDLLTQCTQTHEKTKRMLGSPLECDGIGWCTGTASI